MVSEKSGSSHGSGELKVDISEEELKKLYSKASTQRFDENPRYPMHSTSGVVPMSIKGRFAQERERLGPDFDETQRQWRIKWIQDQKLHPNEPFDVKQLYIEYHNPIRRFYRKPMDLFEEYLRNHMNRNKAMITRKTIGRGALIYVGFLSIWYYLKYNREHWEQMRGARIFIQRENVYPGDPRFPQSNPRPDSNNFYDRSFSKRTVLRGDD